MQTERFALTVERENHTGGRRFEGGKGTPPSGRHVQLHGPDPPPPPGARVSLSSTLPSTLPHMYQTGWATPRHPHNRPTSLHPHQVHPNHGRTLAWYRPCMCSMHARATTFMQLLTLTSEAGSLALPIHSIQLLWLDDYCSTASGLRVYRCEPSTGAATLLTSHVWHPRGYPPASAPRRECHRDSRCAPRHACWSRFASHSGRAQT